MTRVVVISDLHCGSRSGLTPSEWQYKDTDELGKLAAFQRESWDWYCAKMAELQPIDRLVMNGDGIDGKGSRQGGTDQQYSDRNTQVRIAARVIEEAHAKRIVIIKGTPYHVSEEGEDFEEQLAALVRADKCGAHEWIEAHGTILDFKHKIGTSQIPHGRHTALARARLWNLLWSERQLQPRAQIVVRSHVHYHVFDGGAGWLAMTTPGLQGWTKYGGLEMEGTIDYGLVSFDIDEGGWSWKTHLVQFPSAAAHPLPA